jgi:DNA-binding LacI/PurR family transcriptional regulator
LGPLAAPFLALTTFRQPVQEIGRTSVELLLDRIEGTTSHDRLVALRGDLVVGRTTGPPAAPGGEPAGRSL